MIQLSPTMLQETGTASQWFQKTHDVRVLQAKLTYAFCSYGIEHQANDSAGRLVLEAIIFAALLDYNQMIHQHLGVTVRGGAGARDPSVLSIIQVELLDLIGQYNLASMSFTYNESTENWDGFNLQESMTTKMVPLPSPALPAHELATSPPPVEKALVKKASKKGTSHAN